MFWLVQMAVPLGICVALPVLIVWIIYRASTNGDNKRAEVLIEAIRSNNGIDADRLAEALAKPRKTPAELLNLRLLRGCIFSLIGVAAALYSWYASCSFPEMNVQNWMWIIAAASLAIGISYLIVYFVSKKK